MDKDDREFRIELSPALAGGAYAHTLIVTHTPYEFTLDFCINEGSEDEVTRLLGVARVRIPVAIVFEVIKDLNDSMTDYERIYGEIRPPGLSSEEP